MKNKFGVKITSAERKYFNSLKQSIRQSSNAISKTLKPYEVESYLRKKTNNFVPTMKNKVLNSFKSREDFLKEVESLSKLKTELAIYKPRKPKYFDELPKRLQKDFEKETRSYGKTKRVRIKKPKDKIERLLNIKFINKRSETYRSNMITAIYKTFEEEIAKELMAELMQMSETQFIRFFLSRPNETIGFVYYNPNTPSTKHLDLMRDILNAKT